MKCFTIVLPIHGNVLPNRLNREKSECDVLLLDPYKQGMTIEDYTMCPLEMRGKGDGKKAETIVNLTDMGYVNKKNLDLTKQKNTKL